MADITDISGQGGMLLPGMAANTVPGMPAIPGMPQAGGGIENLLGALLGGGRGMQPQGIGGIDPRAIRMMLFQQMNRPAQGPFSAIANPIVAALMARQIGPQIAQQQQRQQDMERMKQVLDAMRVGSGITRDQAVAAFNRAKTVGAEAEAETVAQLTPEERLAGERAKRFITPKPGEIIRGQQGERRIALQEEGLKLKEEAAKLAERQAKWDQEMDVANYGQRQAGQQQSKAQFEAQEKRLGEQWGATHERKVVEAEQKEKQYETDIARRNREFEQRERRIVALGGSPELQKAKLNLVNVQVDRTKQVMQQAATRDPATVDTLTNLFKMANEMPRDKAEAFLEENAAPLIAKLTGGKLKIPYDSWSVFSWGFEDINAPIGSDVSGGGSSAMLPTPTPGRPGTVTAPNPAASTTIPATTPPANTILPGGSLPGAAQTDDDFLDQYYRTNPVVIPQQYLPPGR